MKEIDLLKSINDIDNDLLANAEKNTVFHRRFVKIIGGAAAVCVAAVFALTVFPLFTKSNSSLLPHKTEETTLTAIKSDQTKENAESDTVLYAETKTAPQSDTGGYEEIYGGPESVINTQAKIKTTGSEYEVTDENGSAFLESVKNTIKTELLSSGVAVDQITVTQKGYAHVSTGKDGNFLKVNWRDFLVYNGDSLTAIITVYRDSDGFHYGLSFGAPWFLDYALFLSAHKGERLVFIWAGSIEAVITPNSEIHSFITDAASLIPTEEVTALYSFFNAGKNVYIP